MRSTLLSAKKLRELPIEVEAVTKMPVLIILKSKKFILIFLMAVCHFYFGYFWNNQYKIYGKLYINDDKFLTTVGATSSLSNGICKFVFGLLVDIVPFKYIYACLNALEAINIICINWAVKAKWSYLLNSVCIYLCDGSMTAMLPAFTVMQFGVQRGPEVYGYMFSVFAISNFMGVLNVMFLKEHIGYIGMFAIGFVFTILAGILNQIVDRKPFDYVTVYEKNYPDTVQEIRTSMTGPTILNPSTAKSLASKEESIRWDENE